MGKKANFDSQSSLHILRFSGARVNQNRSLKKNYFDDTEK
jgi:hypothetical protein